MYKLLEDQEHFHTLSLDTNEYLDLLDPYIGELAAMNLPKRNMSIAQYWRPISFILSNNNEGATKVPDWSFYTAGNLILNEKAKVALEQLLLGSGELLPLKSDQGRYYFFNCLENMDNDKQKIKSVNIFKASPTVGIDLICTGKLKTIAEEAGLVGMNYEPFGID